MKLFRRYFNRRYFSVGAIALSVLLAATMFLSSARPAAAGQTSINNADPSVIRVGSTYISVEVDNGNQIFEREASSPDGLSSAPANLIWTGDVGGGIWAPEIVLDGGQFYVYYSEGADTARRMYVISSATASGGYSSKTELALPDDKWATDGTMFTFGGQRWFAWSGADDPHAEQDLYIARMDSPTTVTGGRYVISQPRESWERASGGSGGYPYVNEAPEAIQDPSGQLHIVYSANGSWSDNYCLADLRLRAGGDPTYVWDWYKSNGCLFGWHAEQMMSGWDPTHHAKGPGHNSFVLLNGDIATSPPAGPTFPLMYHAVPDTTPGYSWGDRYWYTGSFCWWGNTTYSRANSPGDPSNTGWSLKFFE